MRLKDPFNRPVSNLRMSLTPACNLNCIYCHAEGEVSPGSILSAEEIAAIMQMAKEVWVPERQVHRRRTPAPPGSP